MAHHPPGPSSFRWGHQGLGPGRVLPVSGVEGLRLTPGVPAQGPPSIAKHMPPRGSTIGATSSHAHRVSR